MCLPCISVIVMFSVIAYKLRQSSHSSQQNRNIYLRLLSISIIYSALVCFGEFNALNAYANEDRWAARLSAWIQCQLTQGNCPQPDTYNFRLWLAFQVAASLNGLVFFLIFASSEEYRLWGRLLCCKRRGSKITTEPVTTDFTRSPKSPVRSPAKSSTNTKYSVQIEVKSKAADSVGES